MSVSIRTRLLWLVVCATLVPAILVGLRFMQDREAQIAASRADLRAVAASVATDLNERVRGTAQLLHGLSRARDFESPNRAVCSAFLSTVLRQYPQYTGLLSIDADGQLFCDSVMSGRQLNLMDRAYFREAMASTTQTVVLEPAIGRFTGLPVLQIAYPVFSGEPNVQFVLVASLDLLNFVNDQQDSLRRGLTIVFLDERSTVIVRSSPDSSATQPGSVITDSAFLRFARAARSDQTAEITNSDGTTRIWAAAGAQPSGVEGVRILVGQSRAALVESANHRLLQDLVILTSVSLVLIAGVWLLVAVGLRRHVVRITDQLASLGASDFNARISGPLPGGELGGLMTLLNVTAASLQQQQAAISQLNTRLSQAQKMEALGQLTGGMAHDFNNLLTVILGSSEVLRERLAARPDLLSLAETTSRAAERGAELVRSLLAFARRQPLETRPTDVSAELHRMEALLQRTLGDRITLHLNLAWEVPLALVDPAQLEAALLNLALNARDAMPNGGALTIEVGISKLQLDQIDWHDDAASDDYICISLTDTGIGMSAQVMRRVFEPFFTTKEFGQGSGLGLSMVYGFARQSAGQVKIHSEQGEGTTVKLYLPPAGTAAALADGRRGQGATVGGRECVLAVEDDEMVRAHVIAELTSLGYQVLSAEDAPTALAILRGPEKIDLLFTDVVMPGGMSGPNLAEAARALRPGIRVLYTSGYTDNAEVHGGLDPGIPILSKPYRRQKMAETLRLALGTVPG